MQKPDAHVAAPVVVGSADINHGGPAFPIFLREDERYVGPGSEMGVTVRDYFAAKAMQGFCADGAMDADTYSTTADDVAREAYRLADAMLRARAA